MVEAFGGKRRRYEPTSGRSFSINCSRAVSSPSRARATSAAASASVTVEAPSPCATASATSAARPACQRILEPAALCAHEMILPGRDWGRAPLGRPPCPMTSYFSIASIVVAIEIFFGVAVGGFGTFKVSTPWA